MSARITHRTDYAVRAVLYLSLQEAGRVVPISEIAAETGLSVKFLEEILLLLRTSRIVQSRRGKQGGYLLLRPATELTIADVVHALEGDQDTGCADHNVTSCRPFREVTQAAFEAASRAWWGRLEEVRLSDLAETFRRLDAERSEALMFYI